MASVRILCSFGSCLALMLALLLQLLFITSNLSSVNGEFYSSVDSLKRLDNIESSLLLSFRKYSQALQDDITTIRRFMERIKFQHKKAEKDVEDYLGNPINAFTLIERVVRDWRDVDELLKFGDIAEELTDSLTQLKENSTLPDENELKGTVLGLARLQDIYGIKADDMANGKGYGYILSWRECFEIATILMDESHLDLALTWLQQAHDKLQASQDSGEIKEYFSIQIKEYFAILHQKLGNHENALDHLNENLVDEHMHPSKLSKKIISRLPSMSMNYTTIKESVLYTNFAPLCQGQGTSKESQNLSCRLDSSLHPFFTIAPLQIEPLHLDPFIRVYHNVVNDDQISKLIQYAEQNFYRSQVVKTRGVSETTEKRVSQQAWVAGPEMPISAFMYRLVGMISGFNMTNVEKMQVANYGVGGQYVPHYDFLNSTNPVSGLKGDRITTSMFYLSDVTEGGYTVFPKLNISVKPIKGAMLMWPNLHKSLDPNTMTLHGGCPVVKGSKRIGNIWSHSGYQEMAIPCGLENDGSSSMK